LVYIGTSYAYTVLPPLQLIDWYIEVHVMYALSHFICVNDWLVYIGTSSVYNTYRRDNYIYQSINYTEEVRYCIQKRYLYIPIYQLHRGGKKVYTEEVPIYTTLSYLICVINWFIYIGTSSACIVLPPFCNWSIDIYRCLFCIHCLTSTV
jgi:hypothetical protein